MATTTAKTIFSKVLNSTIRRKRFCCVRPSVAYLRSEDPIVSKRWFSAEDKPAFVEVPIEEAQSTTAKALEMIGWDKDDAAIQAEVMTAAEMCGNNQGLVKMFNPALMAPSPGASKPTIERETATSAVVNANQAPGMLAAVTASDLAVQKILSSNSPIAIVCSYNSSTSSGQLAHYVERIARNGMIGVALCNSPEFVSAAKGGKPVFGTNPLAVGVPLKGARPFTVRTQRQPFLDSGGFVHVSYSFFCHSSTWRLPRLRYTVCLRQKRKVKLCRRMWLTTRMVNGRRMLLKYWRAAVFQHLAATRVRMTFHRVQHITEEFILV